LLEDFERAKRWWNAETEVVVVLVVAVAVNVVRFRFICGNQSVAAVGELKLLTGKTLQQINR